MAMNFCCLWRQTYQKQLKMPKKPNELLTLKAENKKLQERLEHVITRVNSLEAEHGESAVVNFVLCKIRDVLAEKK